MSNVDPRTVASFSDEWSRFDQREMPDAELTKVYNEYFSIFPWGSLPQNPEGFDMGCGSGRWAKMVAPRVGRLHCIDPSEAIKVAQMTLREYGNVCFYKATLDEPCLKLASQDFGYSLGVLHHLPDTASGIKSCAALLRPGAPLLLYLYYAFDNRSVLFRALWKATDFVRLVICRLPPVLKNLVTDTIAIIAYWPLSRISRLIAGVGLNVDGIPLSYYRSHSLYTMRTDSRDRFGTPLERRFTKRQIEDMMFDAGLREVRFSEGAPYWCVIGIKS